MHGAAASAWHILYRVPIKSALSGAQNCVSEVTLKGNEGKSDLRISEGFFFFFSSECWLCLFAFLECGVSLRQPLKREESIL